MVGLCCGLPGVLLLADQLDPQNNIANDNNNAQAGGQAHVQLASAGLFAEEFLEKEAWQPG